MPVYIWNETRIFKFLYVFIRVYEITTTVTDLKEFAEIDDDRAIVLAIAIVAGFFLLRRVVRADVVDNGAEF